jgi:hypothetical protein
MPNSLTLTQPVPTAGAPYILEHAYSKSGAFRSYPPSADRDAHKGMLKSVRAAAPSPPNPLSRKRARGSRTAAHPLAACGRGSPATRYQSFRPGLRSGRGEGLFLNERTKPSFVLLLSDVLNALPRSAEGRLGLSRRGFGVSRRGFCCRAEALVCRAEAFACRAGAFVVAQGLLRVALGFWCVAQGLLRVAQGLLLSRRGFCVSRWGFWCVAQGLLLSRWGFCVSRRGFCCRAGVLVCRAGVLVCRAGAFVVAQG